jgi:colanic acid/amylovoran biosynthesis protein
MTKIFFSGQRNFGNRGCEAILKSTISAITQCKSDVEFLVPSDNISFDRSQCGGCEIKGVEFVKYYNPSFQRVWSYLHRRNVVDIVKWPLPLPRYLRELILASDMVLSIGGDNYSLDYGRPSLQVAIDSFAKKNGKRVVLWGASVGPFDRDQRFMKFVRDHLSEMDMIFARESVSFDYMSDTLGLSNIVSTVDPAFYLEAEYLDLPESLISMLQGRRKVLGFNLSPLVVGYRNDSEGFLSHVTSFLTRVCNESNCDVVLLPHVIPCDGSSRNDDYSLLSVILDKLKSHKSRIHLVDRRLNAGHLKYIIGQLSFFIGARTHSTIAALSMGVPTVSISYSVKAIGINVDLFGHERYVLPIGEVSAESLWESFRLLQDEAVMVRKALDEKVPNYKQIVLEAADRLFV